MKQRKKRLSQILSLALSTSMLVSMLAVPAAAAEPADSLPADLDAIVDILSGDNGIDGETAFDYLGTVFLGWRTTGGPWQNYVINDFIGEHLTDAGYKDKGDSYTGDAFTDWTNDYSGDQFWVQHDESSGLTWAPEYARLEITSIKDSDGEDLEASDPLNGLRDVVNVETFSFDPTSKIYQAHYIEEYGLEAEVGDTDGFVKAMTDWINETDASGERIHVFPDGHEPGDPRGEEAHLNKRSHLPTNAGFNVTADELAAIRENPENVSTLVAGKTGELVYVGNVKKSGSSYVSDYQGNAADLAGKVLLCDSKNSTNFAYAQQVGAISVMTTASLSNFSNPIEEAPWYGPEGEMENWYKEWYKDENEWYTDSARFAGGAGAQKNLAAMQDGKPIVEWNISPDQYWAMRTLLNEGCTVEVNVASVGEMYQMSGDHENAQGQLTAIAEIKGADPELRHERVVLAAHVQEPGCDDNATGVALNMELAIKMKQLIDDGILPRPQRTIVFMWGDEMSFSKLYLNAHEEGQKDVICCIDLDMVGEDPAKTGGPMRIEKAPDPSAYYNYTLDNIPEDPVNYDKNRSDSDGNFVRLPDSHTLWGAGDPKNYDLGGIFINDLYMASAQITSATVKDTLGYDFAVDVCPYEGGSDHSQFLAKGIPAVLTWHFTDYVYHTSVDTLYMASADEMASVGITSLAAGYFAANPTAYVEEMLDILVGAAADRFDSEAEWNTAAHKEWADATNSDVNAAYAEEVEILNAWGDWYHEAIDCCVRYFGSNGELSASYHDEMDAIVAAGLQNAAEVFGFDADVDVDGALTMDNKLLCMDVTTTEFTATLTPTVTEANEAWSDAQWTAWAKGLTWWLTREGSEQDPELYPHVYTGDELTKWTTWGSNGKDGQNYFKLEEPTVAHTDDGVAIEMKFSTATPFFYNTNGVDNNGMLRNSDSYRNIYGSFNGKYTFSVRDGEHTVAVMSEPVMFNIYESYRRYADLVEELEDIKAAAEAKGRYFEIKVSGVSEGGYDTVYVTLSDSAKSVEDFKTINQRATTDPASVQAEIKAGTLEYRVPFMINNVHSDEMPGTDSQIDLLWELATADTITYNTLTGLKSGEADMSQFAPDIVALGITGLGSKKFSGGWNNVTTDASEIYDISEDLTYSVDDLLDNLIIIVSPNENPDGRTYNTRTNANGFDLNRDASNQTQAETRNLVKIINEWNPVTFLELHGYMQEFLVEPCTPPHEPNMEYDLLVKNFLLGGEAYGMAALGTTSAQYDFDVKFRTYYTPLRDDYDPATMTWSAWDDLCTNYGPSYAMLNCGSMGYTVETPGANQASTQLFTSGTYGLLKYVMDNKDDIYLNQLEFFRRGIENEDHRADMESWYVNINNQVLESDTWRVPYAANDKYFPEYYVIPVNSADQRDIADAYEMGEFLLRNGIEVSKLTKNTTVNGVTYKAGSLVVDMYQAKRNYANAVLWGGADASASGFPDLYSESVSNFPEMRGFDCDPVAVKGAFEGKLIKVTTIDAAAEFAGVSNKAVVIANNGSEAVRAVNALLDDGKSVGMITSGSYVGDFLVDYDDYYPIHNKFVLTATGVSTIPEAKPIARPTVYLAGRYAPFANGKITEGYYADWFSNGYGFIDYQNIKNNGNSDQDLFVYGKLLGFELTDDPAAADVIIGSVKINQGATPDAAIAAVKAGTPYISTGNSPLSTVTSLFLNDMQTKFLGMEALHTVEYPSDSLITASYASDKDFVMYTCNCGVITTLPEGATVLIKAIDEDSFLAGCCLNDDGTPIDGFVEAFAIERDGMDLTVFANSIINRAHQQDDFRYVTNTIYSKMLGDNAMEIDLKSDSPALTESGSTGGGSTGGSTKPPVPTEKPSDKFVDIRDSWAYEDIATMIDKGLMNGISDTLFAPDLTLTRGMMVTLYHRMDKTPNAPVASFKDVDPNAFYAKAVNWGAYTGLVKGYSADTYAPNDPITREQLITMMYNYARYKGMDVTVTADLSGYVDNADVSDWAADAMSWAVANRLVTGRPGNRLDPQDTASRSEIAALMVRFMDI